MSFLYTALCRIWQFGSSVTDKLFRHGCDFSGWVTIDEIGLKQTEGEQYQPTMASLRRSLRRYRITEADSILDIGCGKGYAMYLMRKFPFGQVAGYDISQNLVNISNENFRKLKLTGCSAFQANALEYTDYDNYNFFYSFNSVPEPVMAVVMKNIAESIRRKPRTCTFIYSNPVCHEYIENNTVFKLKHIDKAPLQWLSVYHYQSVESL